MHHPLRFIVPPLVVVLGVLVVYLPLRRHAVAVRENPHHNPQRPITDTRAASVVAGALIVAFIAAFILP